jgi:hypothetical protein
LIPGADYLFHDNQSWPLVDLWTIVCGVAIAFVWTSPIVRRVYVAATAVLLAMWFNREFDGNLLFFLLTAETAVIYALARWLKDEGISTFSHVVSSLLAVFLAVRLLFLGDDGSRLFAWEALVSLLPIVLAAVAFTLTRDKTSRRVHLSTVAVFLAMWLDWLFDGNLLFLMLTLETAALSLIALILKDSLIDGLSHVAWAGMAILLTLRLVEARTAAVAFFNVGAAIELLAILLAAGAMFLLRERSARETYGVAAHLALMAWFARELLPYEDGQGMLTVAWGLYGAVILIVGLRRADHVVRKVGLGTLMLLVAKLFLIDLSNLETIWRVLLFVGFGGVFLALSYYFPKLWKKDGEEGVMEEEG